MKKCYIWKSCVNMETLQRISAVARHQEEHRLIIQNLTHILPCLYGISGVKNVIFNQGDGAAVGIRG